MYSQFTKSLIDLLCKPLSFKVAVKVAKRIMSDRGFGAGAGVRESGEKAVFTLVHEQEPVLFDVGAHIGAYTKAFIEVFPNGKSFAFEPSLHHREALEGNLKDVAGVKLFACALGEQAGTASLFKNSNVTGLASLTKRRLDHFGLDMNIVENVDVRTLDDIVTELAITKIHLLKIDVEGHELSVLNGAKSSLQNNVIDIIQFEFGGANLDTRTTLQDFYYFFKEFGFKIAVIAPSGRCHPIDYDEFFEHYRTTNFVAGRPSIFGKTQ